MEMLFAGVILGFVLSSVLFIQKIWREQDKAEEWKSRAEFYKKELLSVMNPDAVYINGKGNVAKVKEILGKCNSSDLFGPF